MINTKLKGLGFILTTALFITTGAGMLKQEIRFAPTGVSTQQKSGYDLVRFQDCSFIQTRGAPSLPVKLISISIPAGAEVTGIEIVASEYRDLPGTYRIYPTQPARPLPMIGFFSREPEFVPPDHNIYVQAELYPAKLIEFTGQGSLGGYEIAGLLVYPIQYLPSEGRLRLYTRIEFALNYRSPSSERTLLPSRSRSGTWIYQKMVEQIVMNPKDVRSFAPTVLPRFTLATPTYEHVIITADKFRANFEPLSDWLTKKGILDSIVSVEYIYSHYTGRDNQERIRNFIRDAYENWGTVWILLGGDTDVVPARTAFAFESGVGSSQDEDSLKCDLYYSDLDGSWDANNNGIFGEMTDSVDLYPDVFVGRAGVNSSTEIDRFVAKALIYEKNPPLQNYPRKALFMAYHLDDITHAEYAKDSIDIYCFPPRFDPITKLYQDYGAWGRDTAIAELNSGKNLINHDDHANQYAMGVGAYNYDELLYNYDMDGLTNGNKLSILYSIGCWAAAIDYDCIAEHFVNAAQGGGAAFIGNSRYGWYDYNNAGAYSGDFDQEFFDCLFNDGVYEIGLALAQSKIPFIPWGHYANPYRWIEYNLNLLGEPTLGIWTDVPETLQVSYPPSIPTGPQSFTVSVSTKGIALANALVCVWKDEEVYDHGLTGGTGSITFSINPFSGGPMSVTVTAENRLPFEDSCDVQGIPVPDIAVVPDTLLFDCSGGSGTLRYLMPNRLMPRHLMTRHANLQKRHHAQLEPVPAQTAIGGQRKNLFRLANYDTLQHSFESPFYTWHPDYQIEYEATCLTPAQPFSLKLVEICFGDSAAPATNTCSLIIWQDNGGIPGNRDFAEEFTVSLNPDETVWWQLDVSDQNLVYSTPFWIGHFENTAGWPTSLLDANPTPGDYYAADGYYWIPEVGDYLQRALGLFPEPNGLLDTMIVANVGLENLVVTDMVPFESWITVIEPKSFVLAPDSSQAVEILVDSTGLADGVYRGTIVISSNDPNENPYNQPVKLLKGPQPHIAAAPDTIAFYFGATLSKVEKTLLKQPAGNSPPLLKSSTHRRPPLKNEPMPSQLQVRQSTDAQTMWVKNAGEGNLIVSAITTAASWITDIEPSSFTVAPQDSQAIMVTADDGGVDPGTYIDSLAIQSNDPDKNPYFEPLKLIKEGGADITTNPDTLMFDLTQGSKWLTDRFWIFNPGLDNLTTSAETQTSWIVAIYPNRFTIPPADSQCLWVKVDTTGLSDSTSYDGEVILTTNVPGKNPYREPVKIIMPTAITETDQLPKIFELSPITPNPFTRIADIHYALPKISEVSLKIYDISGTLVKTLVSTNQAARFYTVHWDGRDEPGRRLAKGIYFIRMDTPEYQKTRKLILVR